MKTLFNLKLKSKLSLFALCILTVALSLITAGKTFSQGTLQFNQVKLIGTTDETVPAGKVWKIENVLLPNLPFIKFSTQDGGSCGCNSSASYSRDNYVTAYTATELNGKNNISVDGYTYAFNPSNNISSVIWIPTGSYVAAVSQTTPVQKTHIGGTGCYAPWWLDGVYQNCNTYTPPTVTIVPLVTVIEFNVIP